jgi:hypothetical protein
MYIKKKLVKIQQIKKNYLLPSKHKYPVKAFI